MVRHIVAWDFTKDLSEEEKQSNAVKIKSELENLKNLIKGIVSIEVLCNPLNSSDSDIMLDSVFESEEALNDYRVHPEHVRVGNDIVKPVTTNRKSLDFSL